MDLSLDGNKLLVVTGVPHYELTIWDLDKEERMNGKESSLLLKTN